MGTNRTAPNGARRAFVKAAGIFGKYLFRGMSYVGENAVAFLGLTATIAGLFLVSSAFGLTVPVIVAAAESAVATLAGLPLLAGTVALAAAIAAPETLKKIYKDCAEWVVGIYKNAVANLFKPKSFDITADQLAVKQAKHPEKADKYATVESYKAAKEAQLKAYDKKAIDLDLAGKVGKRAFKNAANGLADGFEWVAGTPGYLYSCLPGFSLSRSTGGAPITASTLTEPLLKNDNDGSSTLRPRGASLTT